MISARDTIAALWLKHGFKWDECYRAIKSKEPLPMDENGSPSEKGIDYVTILDDGYPKELTKAPKPPFVLFYKGDLSILKTGARIMAIVGPTAANEATKTATERLVSDLAMETVFAVPILGRAAQQTIESAVSSGAKIVGIVPHDIESDETAYKEAASKILSNGGLLISEYAGGKAPPDSKAMSFRILASLADATLVTDSTKRGPERLAIAMALNCGKEVACLPHEPGTSENNSYIKEGAALVEGADDLRLLFNTIRKEP